MIIPKLVYVFKGCAISKKLSEVKCHYKEPLLLNIDDEKEFLIEKHGTVMFDEN